MAVGTQRQRWHGRGRGGCQPHSCVWPRAAAARRGSSWGGAAGASRVAELEPPPSVVPDRQKGASEGDEGQGEMETPETA